MPPGLEEREKLEHGKRMENALRESRHVDYSVEVMPGLNHFFQTADTGSPMEYGRIEETFAPVALERIAAWVLDRVY